MVARIVIVCLAVIALAALALTKPGIETIAGSVTGTRVSIGSERFAVGHAAFGNVTVRSLRGEPLARIARLDVTYNLHSVTLDSPVLTLIRHRDGTWNFPIPKANPNAPARTLNLDARVRHGSVTLIDESQGTPAARRLYLRNVNAAMQIHTAARTQYRASLQYVESGKRYPIRGVGDLNARAGYAVQRWILPAMPIARIVDVALNSPSLHLATGSITGSRVQILGLADGHGGLQTHVRATTKLQHVRMAIGGLVKPVRGLHGRVDLFSDGLTFDGVRGTIANVPLRLLGGVYGTQAPRLRIALDASGHLAQLRQAIAQSAHLPIHGRVHLAILLEGHASSPLAMIAVDGKRIDYAGSTIEGAHGLVAFSHAEFDLLDVHGRYHGVEAGAQGRVALTSRPNAIEVIAGAQVPAAALPYAAQVVPGMRLRGMMLATANDPKRIRTSGVIDGSSARERLAGTFSVDSRGVGTIGPLAIRGSRGSLYADVALDHPHGVERGIVRARNFRIAAGTLPIAGTLDGAIAGALANGGAHADGTIVAQGRYQQYPVNGFSALHLARGTLGVRDAAVRAGPALVAVNGRVEDVTSGAPRYDLNARARAVNVAYNVVDASVDANVHVGGSGRAPSLAGTVDVPTGSVNGQAFRDLHATLHGTPAAMTFSNGGVMVDETAVNFNGVAGTNGGNVALRAPHARLSDFNDLFDSGETLAGTGSVDVAAAYAPGSPLVTSGNVNLRGVRYRHFPIGTTHAAWHTSRGSIHFVASAGGPAGAIRAHGRVNPSTYALAATTSVRALALATWLPIFGINEPVLGFVDADATVAGRFPDVSSHVTARLLRGSAYGIPVQQAAVALRTAHGVGTLERATVRIANASASASGRFGLHARDRLNLVARVDSPDIGAVARAAGMHAASLAGRLSTTATLRGTRLQPRLADVLTLTGVRYGKLLVPRIAASSVATLRRLTLQHATIALPVGSVMVAATVPLPLRNAPFSASLTASDVDLAQFARVMPSGTVMTGRVDGRVTASGRTDNPQFGGQLVLADAGYSGPQESVPIRNAQAQVAFFGDRVQLRQARADVGGGRMTASGSASVPSVRDVGALAFHLRARANDARIDAPAYYKGRINGTLVASRAPRGMPTLGGDLAFSSGRVPLTAIFNPAAGKKPAAAPPAIAFHRLRLVAANDVRVQSPNVDVGAEGGVTIGGTLAAPSLAGSFVSTGGTVSFYRDFRIAYGSVTFDPSSGIMPYVNAAAVTTITNPDTRIRLHVNGLADSMQLGLASDPAYTRSQILGLLVGAQTFGAVQGIAAAPGTFSASNSVASLAAGQLNSVFTRSLLEPLSTALGGAFGLNNVQLTNSINQSGGGFGARFAKAIGKHVNVVFAQTFGQPRRQSLTLESRSKKAISLAAVFYTQEQPSAFGTLTSEDTHQGLFGANVISIQPMSGTNGINVRLERKFP